MGYVINLATNDIERFQMAGCFVHFLITGPLTAIAVLIIGIYMIGMFPIEIIFWNQFPMRLILNLCLSELDLLAEEQPVPYSSAWQCLSAVNTTLSRHPWTHSQMQLIVPQGKGAFTPGSSPIGPDLFAGFSITRVWPTIMAKKIFAHVHDKTFPVSGRDCNCTLWCFASVATHETAQFECWFCITAAQTSVCIHLWWYQENIFQLRWTI